jgi:pimeloyl-ACP methyl ester carboxylesterase
MKVLEVLKSRFNGRYISVSNNSQKIWTISANLTSKNIPLVLIHGYAGGVGLWSLNFDQLCSNRPVYAIDLPGFGRSSRPIFSLDPKVAEKQFIDLLEEWRIEIGLNQKFILLGHSFGGFLSTSYALNYPKYVKQLVLIDPWGFGEKPEDIWQTGRLQKIPIWLRSFSSIMMKLSPLTGLRAVGPFGNLIVKRIQFVFMIVLGVPIMKYFRSDMRMKFETLFDDDRILVYLYHCNAQLPTGEQAFQTISDCFAWAKGKLKKKGIIHFFFEYSDFFFRTYDQSNSFNS